ncbi:Acetyl-coenzyme A synthetase [bacterium HR41]|nr:Acetyl-coenzyme A synthetase [bacterium HR41]
MNFARDIVDRRDRAQLALVAIDRSGERREITFGEVSDRSARLAGTLVAQGVGRGDVVMTVIGNRPEWVYTLLACWRIGAVAQPCTEQLTASDLRKRIDAVAPRAIVCD